MSSNLISPSQNAAKPERCQLCGREVTQLTLHHLVPVSRGKRRGHKSHELPTAWLCSGCHRQLHALFSNRELETLFPTLEALQQNPKVQKFVAWISRQDPDKRVRVRR